MPLAKSVFCRYDEPAGTHHILRFFGNQRDAARPVPFNVSFGGLHGVDWCEIYKWRI
jgi:hypothetical protein